MMKLNRTTEYSLIALRHMSRKSDVTSAREISEQYGLPFEITAKTLQRLKDTGLIQSSQGARGGYVLKRDLDQVSLGEFIELVEGPQAVVNCCAPATAGTESCGYSGACDLRPAMSALNARLRKFLFDIRLNELTDPPAAFANLYAGTPSPPMNFGVVLGEEP